MVWEVFHTKKKKHLTRVTCQCFQVLISTFTCQLSIRCYPVFQNGFTCRALWSVTYRIGPSQCELVSTEPYLWNTIRIHMSDSDSSHQFLWVDVKSGVLHCLFSVCLMMYFLVCWPKLRDTLTSKFSIFFLHYW